MNKKFKYKTSSLLRTNNFLVGMGSILNLSGSYFDYNYSKSALEADDNAIASDWENVGEDIKIAKETFERKNKKELCL